MILLVVDQLGYYPSLQGHLSYSSILFIFDLIFILIFIYRGITSASSDSKYLALKHRTHIDIWTLKHPNLSNTRKREEIHQSVPVIDKVINGCSLTCRIQLKTDTSRDYFHSIALSNNGKLLAATGGGAHESDSLESLSGLRIWSLNELLSTEEIIAEKIPLPFALLDILTDGMCQSIAFSNDGSSLCVAVADLHSVKLLLLDIQQNQLHQQKHQTQSKSQQKHNISVTLRDTIHHSRLLKKTKLSENSNSININENLSLSVSSVSYSADGRWLAVCSSDKRVFIYEIDRLMLHWELPTFESAVSCLAFHPQSSNTIIIVLSGDNSFHIFDVQDKSLTPWSLENNDLISTWAENLGKSTTGSIVNVSFDPTHLNAFVLHGQAFSVYINLDHPISHSHSVSQSQSQQLTSNSNTNISHQQNYIPSLVTNELLLKPETKIEQLEREINTLLPTCRRNKKKRKKLEQLLQVERQSHEEEFGNNNHNHKNQNNSSHDEEVEKEKTQIKKKLKKQSQSDMNGIADHNKLTPIVTNDNRNFSVLKTHRSIVHLSLLNSHEMV